MRDASFAERIRSQDGASRVPELICSCMYEVTSRIRSNSTGASSSGLSYTEILIQGNTQEGSSYVGGEFDRRVESNQDIRAEMLTMPGIIELQNANGHHHLTNLHIGYGTGENRY